MALPFIYIAIMIAGVFLTLGLLYKDHTLITIAAFFIMILGVFTFVNGVDSINNYVTTSFSTILIAVGGYFAVTEGISFIKEYLG